MRASALLMYLNVLSVPVYIVHMVHTPLCVFTRQQGRHLAHCLSS